MGTSVTINGIPVLAGGPVVWSLSSGTAPNTATFDVTPDARSSLLGGGSTSVTLKFDIDGGSQVTVSNLWVLEAPPADVPQVGRILLADRRWLWNRSHVLRRYNMRRKIGVRRIERPSDTPELQPVDPNLTYAEWSMNQSPRGGNNVSEAWKPSDILRDVVKQAALYDPDGLSFSFKDGVQSSGLRVEQLEVDTNGSDAIDQVLKYFPQVDLYIDYDGSVVFYSKASGEESAIFHSMGPEKVSRGHVALVKNSLQRPRSIKVYFTREHEVRFDFNEFNGVNLSKLLSPGEEGLLDGRFLENVIAVPDFELDYTDSKGAKRKAAQGEWLPIDQVLTAWGLPGDVVAISGGQQVTSDLIRTAFMPYQDIWHSLLQAGVKDVGLASRGSQDNKDWPGRISALQRHWRRTFQINPRWWDRILEARANRVATINPENARRAPAEAYTEVTYVGTQRSYFRQNNVNGLDENGALFSQINGYPSDTGAGGGPQTNNKGWNADARAAPADVVIADPQQGVIQINWRLDPWRVYEKMLPGLLDQTPRPGAQIINNATPVGWDMIKDPQDKPVQLRKEFNLCLVLTCIPGAPNNHEQLHHIEVFPGDVEEHLEGAGLGSGLTDATGPPMDIRIGGMFESARVVWSEDNAADIEAAFGFGGGGGPLNIDPLIINQGGGQSTLTADITNIAIAAAARVYASLADRVEGTKTGTMRPIRPGGWIDDIDHDLQRNGDASTQATSPAKMPSLHVESFLDPTTRAILNRMVMKPGGF